MMTGSPAAPVLLEGVTKQFGATPALKGLSTAIQAGRLTGLVGPDGAGKTTLIRLMAGLMAPSSGRISILGLDTRRDAADLAEVVGYMPQRFGLYEDLSVMENLRLYAALRGVDANHRDQALDPLLTFTRLGPFTRRLAGNLSGGMKQKLGLACALLGTPKVLLLDEPSVGVDPVSRQDLWAMVAALTAKGLVVVWATAYLDEAERCESVLLLNEGELRFAGPPAALTGRIADRCWRLSGALGDRRALLQQALDLPSVGDGVIQCEEVRLVLREHQTPAAIEALAKAAGARLEVVAPRFEDAFVDLLGGGPGGTSALAERMPAQDLGLDFVVECRHLTKRFGAFVATDDVTFQVRPGEIFGLLGPNGAGKSTTFKMLCGLLKPSSGDARVAGLDLRHAGGQAKGRLGYMAQKFSLYGLLSVRQNLAFYAGVQGLEGPLKRERIAEMVATFQLSSFLDRAPEELPLGYKQRLALACALMHRPPVLFLDEPTSGVDPLTRREFWTHINGLVRKGVTVMVTTHFMDEAEYCDRIALMVQARVIALDTPDALKARVALHPGEEPTMEQTFIRLIERSNATLAVDQHLGAV